MRYIELRQYLKPSLLLAVTIWLLALLVYACVSAVMIFQDKSDMFSAKADEITTCVGRRIAQNFAFVESFEIFATLSGKEATNVFEALVKHTMKQNPRIRQVNLYEHTRDHSPISAALVASFPFNQNDAVIRSIMPNALEQPHGTIVGFADQRFPSQYFTAVHARNDDYHYTIIMLVDAEEMLDPLLSDPSTKIEWVIGGVPTARSKQSPPSLLDGLLTLEKTIVSGTNTLSTEDLTLFPKGTMFRVSEVVDFRTLFNVMSLIVYCGLSAIAITAGYYALYQRELSRRSQQSEEEALGRATRLEKENRLEHAARVNAVGELAAGIIHELAQPLTSLLNQSQASLKMLEEEETQVDFLQRAMVANVRDAKRAGRILGKIRDYIVRATVAEEITKLNSAIRDIVDILSVDIDRYKVSLTLHLAEPSPVASINKIELEQVIHNLVRNAIEALHLSNQTDRRITIETRAEPNGSILRVSDNGPGLNDDALSQLFQPFFTTKSSGMGLGLSLSQRIVQRAGGILTASSNDGASFTINLPKANIVSPAKQSRVKS
jgi:signal transduction histidine kinase